MPLELVNTIAALTTAIVITATAIAALVQLRHLRAGNQIAGFLTLRNMLDDEAHQRAWALLVREGDVSNDEGYRAYVKAVVARRPTSGQERYADIYAAILLMGNAFEVIGTLVRNGIVDRGMFLQQYAGPNITSWSRLEPYIALLRAERHDDAIFEDFEYMTVLSRAYIEKRPSEYPVGAPRLLPSYSEKTDGP